MFYGYIEPSTPQATKQISYIIYTLPKEFTYSNLQTYDLCDMEDNNADSTTVTCEAWRTNSEFHIKFTPSAYNHNYKLLYIDTSETSKLFTAPINPGSHYLMGVKLYSTDDSLVESMMVNVTTVFGYLLEEPKITVQIPLDAETKGLYDMTFEVGNQSVPPSYDSTASNKIISEIEVTFPNSFEHDLGTGLADGSEIACLPVSGLTFNTMERMRCYLDHSVSSITYPTIRVTGYDRIAAGQVVRFRFAGLKSIQAGLTDYIKIAVPLTYHAYGGAKGYLYRPTGKLIGPTTALASPKAITFTVTESSDNNMVGDLSNYTFAGTIASGFSTVTTADYVSIEFPEHFF